MNESTTPTAVRLSAEAIAEIRRLLSGEGLSENTGVRVGVKGGGCSGFTYTLGFDEGGKDGDVVIEQDGIRIFCDPKSMEFLSGTTLQFSSGLNGKGFQFVNPNATGTCGCGESFSV